MYLVDNEMISEGIMNKFDKCLNVHDRVTRQNREYRIPLIKFDTAQRSLIYHGPKKWSSISHEIRQMNTNKSFQNSLKKTFIQTY